MKLQIPKVCWFFFLPLLAVSESAAAEFISNIVGGTLAEADQFPYYTLLKIRSRPGSLDYMQCGGTLIAPDVVLTAAHCDQWNSPLRRAYVGAMSVKGWVDGVDRECIEWVNHTNWNIDLDIAGGFDFALCKLDSPVFLDDGPLLELNELDSVPGDGQSATVAGLGMIDWETGFDPAGLLYATLPVQNREECQAESDTISGIEILDSMLCFSPDTTNPSNTPSQTCNGDSGGPAVLIGGERDGRPVHTQVGLVSFGKTGCDGHTIFSRISSEMPWIRETVCNRFGSQASFCAPDDSSNPPTKAPKTAKKTKRRKNNKRAKKTKARRLVNTK